MISRLRIISGLLLFVFVIGHLLTLAFGLYSISAMETAGRFLMGPFSNPIGGPILIVSFFVHAALGLWTVYWRNSLFSNWADTAQAALGLAIVPLLLPHIMGTVVGPAMTGVHTNFKWVLAVYWMFVPHLGIQQVVALIVIWVHACYGLFLWMQVQKWWGRYATISYPFAVIVPVTALLGFVESGKILIANRGDPEFMAPVREAAAAYGTVGATLNNIQSQVLWWYAALIAAVLLARAVRLWGKRPKITVTYTDGPTIERTAGFSLLETAQSMDTAHAALCGARGRCGSCAVRVLEGHENLAPPGKTEAETIARRSLPEGVRLACQAMPTGGPVTVERLFAPTISPVEYQELLRGEDPPARDPEPGLEREEIA
ncbi:2Fe-2S iron-sulfur cluster-binding protein [Roseibium sp. MMSF_3544]|uniref:2Fe-2S iron-sulfur cluster-binding protein n=1 Tax=unclassified Roseibium TaxID=2629323 RepID=UPI00273F9AF0|nr:2Fe-2S iron-sulfur cluster-binding protein [Roseibium sp. MMSF_3544]